MLDRYASPPMTDLWSVPRLLATWKRIEVEAARVVGAPSHIVKEMLGADVPTPRQVSLHEELTNHDVAAFVSAFGRSLSGEAQSWLHRYLTSSDVVDTGNGIRLKEATILINHQLFELINALCAQAIEHWATPRLARTHGQPAEASTLGYRLAEFAFMAHRCAIPLYRAEMNACVGRYAGPVGNYRYVTRYQEEQFCFNLGVTPAKCGTQVVSRDRYVDWVFAMVRIASVVESIALEFRLSNLHGIDELSEPSRNPQAVGSSAMPHKVNPILSEGITGLSRTIRAYMAPALESVPLWFERDISHSSFERFSLPTVATLTDAILRRATKLVFGMQVDTDQMADNLADVEDETLSAYRRIQLQDGGSTYARAWTYVREHPDVTEYERQQAQFQPKPQTSLVLGELHRIADEAQTVIRRNHDNPIA